MDLSGVKHADTFVRALAPRTRTFYPGCSEDVSRRPGVCGALFCLARWLEVALSRAR